MFDKISYFLDTKLPWFSIPNQIPPTSIIEIIILALFIYNFAGYIKDKKAYTLLKGIILIFLFYIIANLFDFYVFLWFFEHLFELFIISVAVIFQPELRKALENIGNRKLRFTFFGNSTVNEKYSDKSIDEIIKACEVMSKAKTGALILLEQNNSLIEWEQTGIGINADISSQLLINIFEHNTPLHDGALIIKNNQITSATCYLPLSENKNVSKELGTRHRAAIGASEVSDAVVLVVSEETGKISVAQNGSLKHGVSLEELRDILIVAQNKKEEKKSKNFFNKLKGDKDNGNI